MRTVLFMSRLAKFLWMIRDILESKTRRARKRMNIILLWIVLSFRCRWPGWKGITVEPCGLWETKWEKLRKGSSENEDFRGWSSIFQKKSQICIACHESYPSTHEVSIYFIEIATLQNLTGQTNRGPPPILSSCPWPVFISEIIFTVHLSKELFTRRIVVLLR